MTYIPDCRTNEFYNEKYLVGDNLEFVKGYDWAVQEILNLFANVEVYPELEELLDDNRAVIREGKIDLIIKSITDWTEAQRNELITSMIDDIDEDEYEKIKAKVDATEEGAG